MNAPKGPPIRPPKNRGERMNVLWSLLGGLLGGSISGAIVADILGRRREKAGRKRDFVGFMAGLKSEAKLTKPSKFGEEFDDRFNRIRVEAAKIRADVRA